MTEQEKQDAFLSAFKDLESELKTLVKAREEEHVTFSKALNQVYYQKLDPVISDYEIYDFLRSASELRNMLSHENNIAYPSDEFLKKFQSIVKEIKQPLTCSDIMSHTIISLRKEETLHSAMKKMEEHSLSHLPILDHHNKVLGVFSRSTIFDYLSSYHKLPEKSELTILDFQEFTPTSQHKNDAFLYVAPNAKVKSVYSYLHKREHEKDLVMLLVTKNGNREDPLVGVITLSDFTKTK